MPQTEFQYRNDMNLVTQIIRQMEEDGLHKLPDGTYFLVSTSEIHDFRCKPAKTQYQRKFEAKWRNRGRSRRLMHCYFVEPDIIKAFGGD